MSRVTLGCCMRSKAVRSGGGGLLTTELPGIGVVYKAVERKPRGRGGDGSMLDAMERVQSRLFAVAMSR